MTELSQILDALLTGPTSPPPIADVADWWSGYLQTGPDVDVPLHRAILGGFYADRLGYAFAAGYREAMRFMFAGTGTGKWALCATEDKGAHPRFIQCRLEPAEGGRMTLSGTKSYVTLGPHADGYIVIASTGRSADGLNQLTAVRVPRSRAGMTLTELPPTPFVPELPHARIAFDAVSVNADELLPGDGYTRYLKPFRTVEDVHVMAAACAWLVQIGRGNGWPNTLVEEFIAVILALAGLTAAMGDPPARRGAVETPLESTLAPSIHIALAGALAQIDRLVAATDEHWADVDHDTRVRWQRDRRLLQVASKARARRREVAWQRRRT